MKKISLLFSLMLVCIIGYCQTPPTTIVENGVTYTRILTVAEYLSVGGGVEDEACEVEAGKRKFSGSQIACKPGGGCCWRVRKRWFDESEALGAMLLPAQIDSEGNAIPETDNLYVYYNAELEEIIYR